ncbi:hypothetical protein M409DRAFT_29028 [Zasmidium cellare ATCC 36951]|uniref:Xylanolytic transcriptional activator regulatory domain-containing protein n=1 Tax=Zasmidium cellare ATCC 36951 TaxID=1080233 RepID=A0A6A6C460_ZASCE|nr:uncharacterized protein M409DRAFT_29028 [Zasmidium cellare ATCC 36951]KAF2160642.1 hypothetical protein M409DRAFT_29028 [Zasmidium cellare ATCC 36951]
MQYATIALDQERGSPSLESVQARLIKVHHLLSSSRPNAASYQFGFVVQLSYTLGLHHKRAKHGVKNLLQSELHSRTFWAVYSTDRYLSIVLGRPLLVHSEFMTQGFPTAINDEDLSDGCSTCSPSPFTDCTTLASIVHAKLAQIVGRVIVQHYTFTRARLFEQMRENNEALQQWKAALPPFLSGEVKPASLVPVSKRQSNVLRMFYLHCVILINRPYLLYAFQKGDRRGRGENGLESYSACIDAAVELASQLTAISRTGQRVDIFWFTLNITFNAVSILYLHGLVRFQEERRLAEEDVRLFGVAKSAHQALAEVSQTSPPALRYTVVLDTLRAEVDSLPSTSGPNPLDASTLDTPRAGGGMYDGPDIRGDWHASDDYGDLDFLISEVLEIPGAMMHPFSPLDTSISSALGQVNDHNV